MERRRDVQRHRASGVKVAVPDEERLVLLHQLLELLGFKEILWLAPLPLFLLGFVD